MNVTKTKLLSILTVLTLLFAAPVMAQVANLSEEPPAENGAQQESQDGETDANVEAEAQAQTGTETQSMSSEENLPETAGPLALLAVLGTTGLASAFGLRRLRHS